jgi:sigma-E factor negative regulatory protein RseC
MKNPEGQVVSVTQDALGTLALVRVAGEMVCERCAAGKGCGAGLLGSQAQDRQLRARVVSNLSLHSGDRVSVALEPQHLLRAAVIVYGYPLLSGVLAAIVAALLGFEDLAAAFAALIGLGAGILLARIRVRNSRCLQEFTPVIVARLSSATD